MFDLAEYLKFLVALIAIIDAPGVAPMYLQQTEGMSLAERLVAALTAAAATAGILLLFATYGEPILGVFGITIAAFKILGGIVILLIALEMLGLRGEQPDEGAPRAAPGNPVAVGVFPLATPLFAGPGAITTVMVYAHEDFRSDHDLIVAALILGASGVILVTLALAAALGGFITPRVQNVFNRLLGMLVGALGVEFILEGVAEFFPRLAAAA